MNQSFGNFVKSELKQLATSEENIDYKKLSQEFFLMALFFFKRYSKPYIVFKNLLANKIGINTVNDDQRDFVFDQMKGYNVSNFLKKSETKNFRKFVWKSKFKALDIHLKRERNYRCDKYVSSKKILKRH